MNNGMSTQMAKRTYFQKLISVIQLQIAVRLHKIDLLNMLYATEKACIGVTCLAIVAA